MNLEELKNQGDLNLELDRWKSEYDFKKNEIKESEVSKMRDEFKLFFEKDQNFQITSENGVLIANYGSVKISLEYDDSNTRRDPTFATWMKLKTANGIEHQIRTVPDSNVKTDTKATNIKPNAEESINKNIAFYKGVVTGEIKFSFKYQVDKTKTIYKTMQELLNDI